MGEPVSDRQRRSRTVWIAIGIAVALSLLVLAALVPGILAKQREEERAARLRRIIGGATPTDAELRDLAPELIPRALDRLADPELHVAGANAMHALVQQAWALELLTVQEQGRYLGLGAALEISAQRVRFPVEERRWVYLNSQGPWLGELALDTEGELIVTVDDREVARHRYVGEPDRGGSWWKQASIDLQSTCPDTGSYTLRAVLRLTCGDARGERVETLPIEVVPGDWRAVVTRVDDAEARALVSRAVDIAFGNAWQDIGPDLHLTPDADHLTHWSATTEPLPFWIWHDLRVELDGETLPITGLSVIRPGTIKPYPNESRPTRHALTVRPPLPAGTHTVTVRLTPNPRWLLREVDGDEVPMYGAELVFERTLVVE